MDKVCRSRIFSPRRWLRKRGYGVHSPFIYELARKVLLHGNIRYEGDALYETLLDEGVGRRSVSRLCSLMRFLEPSGLDVIRWPEGERIYWKERAGGGRWRQVTILCMDGEGKASGYSAENAFPLGQGTVLAVAGKRRCRQALCARIHALSECLCVDLKGLTIYLYDDKLPVGRFNL